MDRRRISRYISDTYRFQVMLEGFKRYEFERFYECIDEFQAVFVATIAEQEEEVSAFTKKDQAALIAFLVLQLEELFGAAGKVFLGNLDKLSDVMARLEATSLGRALNRKLRMPANLWPTVAGTPISGTGDLVKVMVDEWVRGEAGRITKLIRKASVNKQSNADIIRMLRGQKRLELKDGVAESMRRNSEVVVDTTAQHAGSISKFALWKLNGFEKYIWISVLDARTSTICRSLSNQVFPLDNGPKPPAHPRCRSSIRLLLPDEDANNPVSGPSYYDWLKAQPPGFQNVVLGSTRGKLFRDGGLSPAEFARLNLDKRFRPLTLEEMRALNPDAFENADL